MHLTIDPSPKPSHAAPELARFMAKPDNLEPAAAIARSFDRIARLLGNGHLLALRACVMPDGVQWLHRVAGEIAAVENSLTLEWHALAAARKDDGADRYALDGRATSLLGFLRELEVARQRELQGHLAEADKMRGRLAAAGLEPEAIAVAMNSTATVNAARQEELESALAKCKAQSATLLAYTADPMRDATTLGDELLAILRTPQPHVSTTAARNAVPA